MRKTKHLLACLIVALLITLQSCGSSSSGRGGHHKPLKHRDHTWGQFG